MQRSLNANQTIVPPHQVIQLLPALPGAHGSEIYWAILAMFNVQVQTNARWKGREMTLSRKTIETAIGWGKLQYAIHSGMAKNEGNPILQQWYYKQLAQMDKAAISELEFELKELEASHDKPKDD